MAVAFRSASTASDTVPATSVTVTKPSGVVDGDFLVAIQQSITTSTGTYMTHPGGWIAGTLGNTIGSNHWIRLLYKTASSEPANYTFGSQNGGATTVSILAFTGVDTSSPFAASIATWTGSTAAGSSKSTPSVTPSQADAFLVRVAAAANTGASARTWTPPASHAEVLDYGAAAAYSLHSVATRQLASTSATGTANFTTSSSSGGSAGTAFALRPEAAAPMAVEAEDDTASLTEASTLAASNSRADQGSVTESRTLSAIQGRSDAASVSDGAAVSGSSSAVDAATVVETAALGLASADAGSVSVTSALSVAGSGLDSGAVAEVSGLEMPGADSGALEDVSALAVDVSAFDGAMLDESATTGSETPRSGSDAVELQGLASVGADSLAGDSAEFAGSAVVDASGGVEDFGEMVESAVVAVSLSAADSASVEDSASLAAVVDAPGRLVAALTVSERPMGSVTVSGRLTGAVDQVKGSTAVGDRLGGTVTPERLKAVMGTSGRLVGSHVAIERTNGSVAYY